MAALGAPDPVDDPGRGASAEAGPSSEEDEEDEEAGAAGSARVGAKRSAALAGLPQGHADPRNNPARAGTPELGKGVGWGDEDAGGEGLGVKETASGGAAAEAVEEAPLTKRQRKRQKAEQEARLRAAELRQLEAPCAPERRGL